MGAVSTLAADKLKIKGAIRSALAALAAVIDSNTSGISSNTSNLSAKDNVATLSDNTTLTAAQNGGVFLVDTDAKTITLPATAEGLKYTFVNAGADGDVALTVSPAAGDAIIGSIPNSAGDSVS